ncbi:MAG: DUF3179 domain-containing protein [Alphaproteobacteria bacterium]|nr:DUF3179 domain-containing protein [Alphaproteobacteria bacterium]
MKQVLPALLLFFIVPFGAATANPSYWKSEWPKTDFTKHSVAFEEILSGGPPKDGIPSVDNPKFVPVAKAQDLTDTEPVIGLTVNGVSKAYPLRILIWHEIVNDTIGGVPVSVTFCPLCNTAVVYDRRLDGKVLDFGTTGKLRNSDLVMYDRQTESWWQQFLGQGIIGEMTGKTLKAMPARLESWAKFKARAPQGQVQVPRSKGMRNYGGNPYAGYDSLPRPFLYSGEMPANVAPLSRVVSTLDRSQAWSLDLLREKKEIRLADGLIFRWTPGQNSALDSAVIAKGSDVGNVTAQRDGKDIPYFVDFAFAFHAFFPKATIHSN